MTGQYGSRSEPSQNIVIQALTATIEYYRALARVVIVNMCNTSVFTGTTPAASALFMILIPTVQFIYTRRIEAYMTVGG